MKRLFLLFALVSSAAAQNANQTHPVGWGVNSNYSESILGVSASTTRFAYSFTAPAALTLSSVRFPTLTVSGTLASGDVRVDLFSDSAGNPGTTLANSTTTTGALTSNAWNEQTGFSYALTAGTVYWVVFQNVDGVPGTNNWSMCANCPVSSAIDTTGRAFRFKRSTDSGATWTATDTQGVFPIVLKFSNGSSLGVPYARWSRSSDTGLGNRDVYSTREVGSKCTTPANASLKVRCISMPVSTSGSPTGFPRFRIYQDTTLIDTTATGSSEMGHNTTLCFSSAVTLAANTSYRFVLSETTQSDTSANIYRTAGYWIGDSDAAGSALRAFNGTCQHTYYNGSSWTDSATDFLPFRLLLNTGDEFVASGGGLKGLNNVSGGAQ